MASELQGSHLFRPHLPDHLPAAVTKRTLFLVTDTLFTHVRRTHFNKATPCTDEEARTIMAMLELENMGALVRGDDFLLKDSVKCKGCGRQRTVYDTFMQGVKYHNVKFIRAAVTGHKKVQMVHKNLKETLVCSGCRFSSLGPAEQYSKLGYACV